MNDADRLAALLHDLGIECPEGRTLQHRERKRHLMSAARLIDAGVSLDPRPDPDAALRFDAAQPFYNAGYAAGARAVLEFMEAAVLALPNEDRDGYEDRWVKRSGVTGLIEIARREYAALEAKG